MADKDITDYLKKINGKFPIFQYTVEYTNKEDEVKQIMLDKLKEMAEIKFENCADGCDYVNICNIMNEIAKTLLDK